ncbi:hypothetical protein HOY80DRAFT_1050906 [Tuber brumale]|nr:hypothetical protein HOY80DRAFT_1050906 [Tuber brumale]
MITYCVAYQLDEPLNASGLSRTCPTTCLVIAHRPAYEEDNKSDIPGPSRAHPTIHLLATHCPTYQQLLLESPWMVDYLATPRPLAVCRCGHDGAQNSPPTDDCPGTTSYPIPESLFPSTTLLSAPLPLASIGSCSTTIPPFACSWIAGSVALSFTILIAGSVTPSPIPPIARSVALSPTPLVTRSGPPSPTLPITGSVVLSSSIPIAGSVVPASTILIAASDPLSPTTPVVAPLAITPFHVAESIPPLHLVADTTTILMVQTTSLPTLPPLHHLR